MDLNVSGFSLENTEHLYKHIYQKNARVLGSEQEIKAIEHNLRVHVCCKDISYTYTYLKIY